VFSFRFINVLFYRGVSIVLRERVDVLCPLRVGRDVPDFVAELVGSD
jgi:hypothetical protein